MSEPLIQTPGLFGENDNFLLERELGAGGMGGVYMGRDKMLDRPVAVKVMLKELGDDPEFVEKFKKEAQSAARLIHPNIAQVYSYGICKGMPYIAMELAAGGSLFSLMNANKGKTDVARVLKICQQVAQALQCASDQGCVHGDVKPENVLFDANGNAKLVDFGLAAMQKDTSEIWGTPYYISPEKVKKEPVDFRSDMYSLGGTLYHALTGVAPFEGDDPIAVVKKRFEGAPKKPSEIRPDLTPAVDALVMKMLALEKTDRYPSFEALLEAFKDVLTNGLTAKAASTATAAAKPASGARRMTSVRGRRMMMKRPGGAALKKVPMSGEGEASSSSDEEDEESGGSLGAKVVLFVFGGILLIGALIGALVWYQVADKKARAAEEQAQISGGIEKARAAIADTIVRAKQFADEFDKFAAGAITACQKPTDELAKILPADQAAQLKPAPTQELLAAIALTNPPPAAVASPTNAPAATTNAAPVAVKTKVLSKFRPPNENEMDPASPEGEAYLKAKKEFEEAELQKLKGGAPAQEPTAEEKTAVEPEKPAELPPVVIDMNDLWARAYGCQASAIRIRIAVDKVVEFGAQADEIKDNSRESMEKLAELSRSILEKFEQIKVSKDVENVKKGISFIKSKGEKTVDSTMKQIRIEKLKAEREAKKAAAEAAEAERKKMMEEERKAKVEEETAAANAKFDTIVAQGCLRQLDWKSALRMLNTLKAEFTTPEGQLMADLQIRKVNSMKLVQDIFLKNLKGYTFRGKLKTCQVDEVNEKEIVLYKPGSRDKIKIPWQKFYSSYPGNLNEIINTFIVNARNPGAKARIASLLEWSNAMTGAALTMQLVCSHVNGALDRAKTLVKTTVAQFPEYAKTAKDIFPDMEIEGGAEEE